jgi:hypothetical protein
MNQDDAYSAQSIRRRLLLLLLRAFGIVVFLTVLLILIVAAIVIARSTGGNPIFRTPTAIVLETYYLGHGSWQGVEAVLEENTNTSIRSLRPDWDRTVVVDANGTVIIDHGNTNSPMIGAQFTPRADESGQLQRSSRLCWVY